MRKNKIKRATFIHRLVYKTFPDSELLRYSVSCFIAGLFFVVISEKIELDIVKNILATIGCVPIALSYFLFPFIENKNKDKYVILFTKYFFLIILTFILTLVLISLCFQDKDVFVSHLLLFIIPISIIDIILIVISINYTLKPIQSIFKYISNTLKSKANENKENSVITYFKSSCANIAVIISFILSFLSFLSTIWNYIKPIIKYVGSL